jgi:hypothetical protein
MGKNGDGGHNLVFEHELAPGQDDEGRSISGIEAIENKFHREGGQPDDLNGDDQEIDRHDDDMKRDKAKASRLGLQAGTWRILHPVKWPALVSSHLIVDLLVR